MKPVVFYAKNMVEFAFLIARLRVVAKQAIEVSGAVRITVEPASPASVEVRKPTETLGPPGALVAARSMKA